MEETRHTLGIKYYWASSERVIGVACTFGVLVMIGFYLDGMHSVSDVLRGAFLAVCIIVFFAILLGTTFLRVNSSKLFYITSLFEWHSMAVSDVRAITLVPRFFFTKKVTAVQIERISPGVFPGMLLSRDAFPDETIAAIVTHLKQLNPAIELDEGIQEILRTQGKV